MKDFNTHFLMKDQADKNKNQQEYRKFEQNNECT